jgi:hypothetical protein
MKAIPINFFDIRGTVHFKFIPQGQTVNQAYYVEVLNQLCEGAHRKRPELWPNKWILHHDNIPAQKVFYKAFLAQKSITEMEYPSYYPDLAPSDFWLFPKIKYTLKGCRFQDTEDTKKVIIAMKAILQQEFHKCFQQCQHCWAKCIAAQGEYFKRDPSQYTLHVQVHLQ